MMDKIQQKIKELEERRSQILWALCEDNRIYLPEVLLSLVYEVRHVTKTIEMLKK